MRSEEGLEVREGSRIGASVYCGFWFPWRAKKKQAGGWWWWCVADDEVRAVTRSLSSPPPPLRKTRIETKRNTNFFLFVCLVSSPRLLLPLLLLELSYATGRKRVVFGVECASRHGTVMQ